MLPVTLAGRAEGLRILCLGAHCDDIEIGCGGTIMKLNEEHTTRQVKWLVFTSTDKRAVEARTSAEYFLQKCNQKEIVIKDFRDGYLPYEAEKVKNLFEELKSFNPDIVFTHCRHDLHQDHRVVCDLTWNTFRDHLIFEYEIPKYDGDLGTPNCYVPLEAAVADKKVQAILDYYGSQASKQWFDRETFFSLMRIRGMESASKTRYAEAFYLRKFVL
jgi:LmbE family N-acetylglucosaminyl deacetylase